MQGEGSIWGCAPRGEPCLHPCTPLGQQGKRGADLRCPHLSHHHHPPAEALRHNQGTRGTAATPLQRPGCCKLCPSWCSPGSFLAKLGVQQHIARSPQTAPARPASRERRGHTCPCRGDRRSRAASAASAGCYGHRTRGRFNRSAGRQGLKYPNGTKWPLAPG